MTYRDTWPHEYVLSEKDDQKELLEAIRDRFQAGEGVAGRFFRMNNTYLFSRRSWSWHWLLDECLGTNKSVSGRQIEAVAAELRWSDRRTAVDTSLACSQGLRRRSRSACVCWVVRSTLRHTSMPRYCQHSVASAVPTTFLPLRSRRCCPEWRTLEFNAIRSGRCSPVPGTVMATFGWSTLSMSSWLNA